MIQRARLACRSPPRFSRCRATLPEEASRGDTPHRWAPCRLRSRSFYDGHGHPFLSLSGLRGGSAVPERSDGAGRSARNRPAHHPLWNGARRASTLLVRNSGRRAAVAVEQPRDLKSGRDPGASEITKDQPVGGGPSQKLNYIIGVIRVLSDRGHLSNRVLQRVAVDPSPRNDPQWLIR
jgi:hypothetical protein